MHRQVLIECLPYVGLLVAAVAVAWLLVRLTRSRPDWRHVGRLASDERGAVQSLSFVLTVPLFAMVMMFIVQLSQLTVAKVVVEYAALATVRSAQVWIPADLSAYGGGGANQLACWQYQGDLTGPDGWKYSAYQVPQQGFKYQKIRQAAIQAVLPICPSRDTGLPLNADGQQVVNSLQAATFTYAPGLAANPKVADRLRNKLAYAMNNTRVGIEVRHKEDEPPLQPYLIDPYPDEFRCGEIGWHDQVIVTVSHDFALLPGPGRLLARRLSLPGSSNDAVADRIQARNGVHVYTLQATARLYNEGQKPRLGYVQTFTGPATAARLGALRPLVSVRVNEADEGAALDRHAVAGVVAPTIASTGEAPCCDDPLLGGGLARSGSAQGAGMRSVLRRSSP